MGIAAYGLLFFGIYVISRHAMKFEKTSRLELLIIPVYSFIMFFVGMTWSPRNDLILAVATLAAVVIGVVQGVTSTIKVTGDTDKRGRPEVLIKKGWLYLLGWLMVFIVGTLAVYWLTGQSDWSDVVSEFGGEVVNDIWAFGVFNDRFDWPVWAVSGFSSLVYLAVITIKEPTVRQAIRRR